MILTLKKNVSKKGIERVVKKVKELGFSPHISKGEERIVIGVIGENAILAREIFEAMDEVDFITPISKSFKLASREFHPKDSIIDVEGIKIGGKEIVIMAGPCAVESKEGLLKIAEFVKKNGAKILRGGAFKPRTSPYSFQGLGIEGLEYLKEAKKKTGLKIITEAMDTRHLEIVAEYADIIQIGARNMQNFSLLNEVGKIKKPVLLKRGISATIREFLMASEYIMKEGNYNVILCERGIRTFETETRFSLDLNAIPVIKKLSHLPIVVDPSHGTGNRDYVVKMSLAAIACGADGLLIEVHNDPAKALSDGPQSITFPQFKDLMSKAKKIANAIGRNV
ncbi:MAG: 3-deoxy-7-phosphoheptulonate synthase [Caldiserica bacterium]|nr:MAG: 3-deoxy-7-phosphoheptulonate synthase [Caldisericota bacterium]